MHDDEVLKAHRAEKRRPFPDCGILMLDCRANRFLIVAAGHGGCGTKAWVRALSNQEEIARRLADSNQNAFEVIVARRTWSDARRANSGSPTDNLELRVQRSWDFAW